MRNLGIKAASFISMNETKLGPHLAPSRVGKLSQSEDEDDDQTEFFHIISPILFTSSCYHRISQEFLRDSPILSVSGFLI